MDGPNPAGNRVFPAFRPTAYATFPTSRSLLPTALCLPVLTSFVYPLWQPAPTPTHPRPPLLKWAVLQFPLPPWLALWPSSIRKPANPREAPMPSSISWLGRRPTPAAARRMSPPPAPAATSMTLTRTRTPAHAISEPRREVPPRRG